jgi:hypothetical protein
MATVAQAGSSKGFREQAGSLGGQLYGPQGLYQHLASLTAARTSLTASQIGHSEMLLGKLDAELAATIGSLTDWRESAFPALKDAPVKTVVSAPPTVPTVPAVVTPPAPAIAPPAISTQAPPVPPLPFTPQTASEVAKHAGA